MFQSLQTGWIFFRTNHSVERYFLLNGGHITLLQPDSPLQLTEMETMSTPAPTQRLQDIYVARQPVYDRSMHVFGYEVLFRDANRAQARIEDHDLASSQVIINTFLNIGLEHLVGSSRALIKLTEGLIINDQLLPMAPEQVVLEVPTEVQPSPAVIDGLKQLRARGYMIALEGFQPDSDRDVLLELADIVKMDLREHAPETLAQTIKFFHARKLKLLADKIETHEHFQQASQAGADYFQGFFFSRPNLVRGRTKQANRLILLRILETLQDESHGIEVIEELIVQDAILTYKLLRYINSASYALRRQIDSVREALLLVGTTTVRNWASLILMSRMNDNKPHELLDIALIRGRMGETLARTYNVPAPAQMFTVGLFSTLDALLDTPMVELLDSIALNSGIKLALLDHSGPMGKLLTQIVAYQDADWDQVDPQHINDLRDAYMEAVQWARQVRKNAAQG